jgi:SOS response regulatory protein OraA/RecX
VPADRDERQKLSAYLARRGFNYSAIRAAWQRVDSSDDLDWLETPESDE